MKGFYDKIVPDFLNKYGKKWGAKVGDLELNSRTAARDVTVTSEGSASYRVKWRNQLSDKVHSQFFDDPEEANAYAKELREQGGAKVHGLTVTPEMKRSVMEEGQPLFHQEKPLITERSPEAHNEIATLARASVVQPANQAPKYIRANAHAMQLITEANGHGFRGVNMPLGDAYDTIDELRNMRETLTDPKAKENVTDLIETLYKGLHYKNGLNIVKAGTANDEIHTIMEEQFHSMQRGAGEGALERSLPTDYMMKDPGIQKLAVRIKGTERPNAKPVVIVAEGVADVLLGDHELSQEQAESTAKKYFGLLSSEHGNEPLEVARAIYDYADQYAAEHGLIEPGAQYDPEGTRAGRSALNSILARRSGEETARSARQGGREGSSQAGIQDVNARPIQGEGNRPSTQEPGTTALRSTQALE